MDWTKVPYTYLPDDSLGLRVGALIRQAGAVSDKHSDASFLTTSPWWGRLAALIPDVT